MQEKDRAKVIVQEFPSFGWEGVITEIDDDYIFIDFDNGQDGIFLKEEIEVIQ